MTRHPGTKPNPRELRDRLLEHFKVLRIPLSPEQFDAAVARAEREHLSHLKFLETLIAEQADQRRERSIQRRIDEARFREEQRLEPIHPHYGPRHTFYEGCESAYSMC